MLQVAAPEAGCQAHSAALAAPAQAAWLAHGDHPYSDVAPVVGVQHGPPICQKLEAESADVLAAAAAAVHAADGGCCVRTEPGDGAWLKGQGGQSPG